jgi:hypothetical protein
MVSVSGGKLLEHQADGSTGPAEAVYRKIPVREGATATAFAFQVSHAHWLLS